MNLNKKLAVAVSGAVLLMAGQFALADSTTDIVDALVSKGVLTEEEGKLISKGAKSKAAADEKANKSRISVGSFIDNATMYGDIRARYERRDGDVLGAASGKGVAGQNLDLNRARYKVTLGIETKSGNLYSDLAFSMGSNGRSDNTTFGKTGAGAYDKTESGLYVKRAMFGWNATDWLSIEAGRMKNPLYSVNAMVFDYDIVFDGAQEKLKYKLGDTNLFANFGQYVYSGNAVQSNDGGANTTARQNMLLAFQAGLDQAFIADKLSAKAAVGYYNYTANSGNSNSAGSVGSYRPTIGNAAGVAGGTTAGEQYIYGVNDLAILDIPAEVNYMVSSNIGIRPYAEYAYNTNGSDRKNAACAAAGGSGALCTSSTDDTAWLVGITLGSAKDFKAFTGKKLAKNDWSANLWYQEVGTYALDQNSVDSDIFDGRLNMKGTVLKAQYMVEDNFALNFTGGWGSRKNSQYGTTAPKVDIGDSPTTNIDDYTLYQFDATYKF
jgi:polyhydroxyalkanoate synthesis regulator phasin